MLSSLIFLLRWDRFEKSIENSSPRATESGQLSSSRSKANQRPWGVEPIVLLSRPRRTTADTCNSIMLIHDTSTNPRRNGTDVPRLQGGIPMIAGVTHDHDGRAGQRLSVSTKASIGLPLNGDYNHPGKLDHFVASAPSGSCRQWASRGNARASGRLFSARSPHSAGRW